MGLTYTFVALNGEGRSPFLDVQMLESEEDAAHHGRELLDEHRSCARIEVWDRHTLLVVVEREPQERRGEPEGAFPA
jgi:hypothetical protein